MDGDSAWQGHDSKVDESRGGVPSSSGVRRRSGWGSVADPLLRALTSCAGGAVGFNVGSATKSSLREGLCAVKAFRSQRSFTPGLPENSGTHKNSRHRPGENAC
jgi:hypothetical protein